MPLPCLRQAVHGWAARVGSTCGKHGWAAHVSSACEQRVWAAACYSTGRYCWSRRDLVATPHAHVCLLIRTACVHACMHGADEWRVCVACVRGACAWRVFKAPCPPIPMGSPLRASREVGPTTPPPSASSKRTWEAQSTQRRSSHREASSEAHRSSRPLTLPPIMCAHSSHESMSTA